MARITRGWTCLVFVPFYRYVEFLFSIYLWNCISHLREMFDCQAPWEEISVFGRVFKGPLLSGNPLPGPVGTETDGDGRFYIGEYLVC